MILSAINWKNIVSLINIYFPDLLTESFSLNWHEIPWPMGTLSCMMVWPGIDPVLKVKSSYPRLKCLFSNDQHLVLSNMRYITPIHLYHQNTNSLWFMLQTYPKSGKERFYIPWKNNPPMTQRLKIGWEDLVTLQN